jgi:histone deacetylase 1/2
MTDVVDNRHGDDRRQDNYSWRQDDYSCGSNNNSRGGGRGPPSGGRGHGRGRRRTSPWVDVCCQICNREGHLARDCWYRSQDHDDDTSEDPHAYGIDTNWYTDTGATHHITSELNNLSFRDTYRGRDKVNTASGQGMDIRHIGHSIIHNSAQDFHLRNILHVLNASKNLLSVHRFTLDNRVFLEFHPHFFLIKDQVMRKILHRGRCVGGLYPLISSLVASDEKSAFHITKPSQAKWHSRLGHPSSQIVMQVINTNKLPFDKESSEESICDPCQRAKSHQLPYHISNSVSVAPLQLIFSDVWGPASMSVGRHHYYVSFIDDYSKFTWIYLLKRKSDVFTAFSNFQKLVERKFDRKILTIQSDWGEEYVKLNSFFQTQGISHHVSCPHAHQQNSAAERKHRHIVEVGLALLAHASVPLKYWDQAFLRATYLINMLPSKVINHDTPVHRLLDTTPKYSSLRVFGCAYWPNLRPYNKHKLAFRSKRCVFFRVYSHAQRCKMS